MIPVVNQSKLAREGLHLKDRSLERKGLTGDPCSWRRSKGQPYPCQVDPSRNAGGTGNSSGEKNLGSGRQ